LLVTWPRPWAELGARELLVLALLATAACVCGYLARTAHAGLERGYTLAPIAVVGNLLLLVALAALAADVSVMHAALQRVPSLVLCALALAAGLAFHARPALRTVAALACAVGLAGLAAGSAQVQRLTLPLAFREAAQPLAAQPRALHLSHEIRLEDVENADVQIAPSGGWVAFDVGSGNGSVAQHTLVARDGRRRTLEANAVAFVGDERLLILERAGTLSALRMLRLEDGGADSLVQLQRRFRYPQLDASPAANRYWLREYGDHDVLLEFAGPLGGAPDVQTSLRAPQGMFIQSITHGSARMGVRTLRAPYDGRGIELLRGLRLLPLFPWFETEVWTVSEHDAHRAFAVRGLPHCHGLDTGNEVVCLSPDSQGRIWTFDLARGEARVLAEIENCEPPVSVLDQTVCVSTDAALYALDVRSRVALRYDIQAANQCWRECRLLRDYLGIVESCPAFTRVSFWNR
jgi:hypothetical protein